MILGADPTKGYLANNYWVPKQFINVDGVKKALTHIYFAGKEREPTELFLYQEANHHLIVPREFWREGTFDVEVVDCRPRTYRRVEIHSSIKLDHKRQNDGSVVPTGEAIQREALNALLSARGGILQLSCGKGKTIIALELISRLQVPALIVVDNSQLLLQWREQINTFLNVPEGVGLIGDGEFDWQKPVVLATYQTLALRARGMPEEIRRWFGVIIWDEAHHVPAPTFSRSADLFYGRRYGLTATPEREDGLHVIHQFHIGPTLYRNLKQDLVPRIYFYQTGLELDLTDPKVVEGTCTRDGNIHLSKLATWYGQWKERLALIYQLILDARKEGRRILVLSTSIDELMNLLCLCAGQNQLYTDIPTPEQDHDEPPPKRLETEELEQIRERFHEVSTLLEGGQLPEKKRNKLLAEKQDLELEVQRHLIALRLDKILNKEQRVFREELLSLPNEAGLMIYKVKSEARMKMLREKKITLAVMKYGKEGLDDPTIDTVILCEPVSSKGILQQVMGRELRYKEGKGTPVLIVVEDRIKPSIAMCQKMRSHLRHWPVQDGGPYVFEQINHSRGTK